MKNVVDAFEQIDGRLRVVASLESTSWEIEYVRDDLRDTYSETDFERAYRALMANQVSSADFSQVVPFGDLVGQLYYLDEVIVFQFPSSRYEGVFASFDRAESFPIGDVFETAGDLAALGTD